MIRDPELQTEVLVKSFMNFHKNELSISDDDVLLKSSPFFSNGKEWQKNRTLFGTFFSSSKIRTVFHSMSQVGKEWEQYVRSLGSNAEVDAKDVSIKLIFIGFLFVLKNELKTQIDLADFRV